MHINSKADPVSRELPAEKYEAMVSLCAQGDTLALQTKYDEAIAKYQEAWDLLPAPHTDWKAATWILTAIGDANFFSRRFNRCVEIFTDAIVSCVSGLGNPYLHLRRGESLFECGRQDEAADELMRAYMGAGVEIFKTEDPKYLRYLKSVARL